MLTTDNLSKVFFRNIAILNGARSSVDSLSKGFRFDTVITSHSSRTNIPAPFKPFIEMLKKSAPMYKLDSVYPTVKDVEESDAKAFERYSSENFTFPKGNILRLLLKSAVLTATDLGLDKINHEKIDLDEAISSFSSTTSSGYPTYKKKGTDEAQDQCRSFFSAFMRSPSPSKLLKMPTTVFHRFQSKYKRKIETKIRQVWALPFCIQTLEAFYFRATIDGVKDFLIKKDLPCSTYGRNLISISSSVIKKFRSYNVRLFSADAESFDSSIPFYFIALFFAVLELVRDDLTRKDVKALNSLMVYFTFTPYAYKGNKFRHQTRGIPSGSLLTSISGTFFSRMIANFAHLWFTDGRYTANGFAVCLGDDNLFALSHITKEQIIWTYQLFGLSVNAEKSFEYGPRETIDFLGYKWDRENRPTQDIEWFLVHFCYPQSFLKVTNIPLALLQTYRAISIAAPLYGGMKIFSRYIGRYDVVYKVMLSKLARGEEVSIMYVGEDRRFDRVVVPLSNILSGGWKYYQTQLTV